MPKGLKIGLGVLLVLILLSLPVLVNEYVQQILILTITYAMLGLAFAFTMKVGLPRFDIAAWWAIGAYTTAILMWKVDMSFWLTLPIGGLIAVGLGFLAFSVVIPRGMMVFLLFGMVLTLAIQQLFGSLQFFGGWGGTPPIPPPSIGSFQFVNKPGLYYMGLVFLAINIIVYYALYNSKIGRAWNAIGSSLKLASSLGIDVVRYRIANALISNFFAAVAGSYFAACTLVAVPTAFSFSSSVYVMMYAVVGGLAHTLAGPIVGSLVITFIPEYLRIAKEWEPVVTAVAIILIIIFVPTGVLGLVDRLRGKASGGQRWLKITRRKKGDPGVSV
jgi:branched-chain amino acid transport system permease protein